MKRILLSLVIPAMGGLILSQPASAFRAPEEAREIFEKPFPGAEPTRWGAFVRSEQRVDAELDLFRERHGGVWAVQRDPILGTPHHLLGSGIDYASGRVETSGRAAELAASFLAENADLLRLDPDRLGDGETYFALGKWSVLFPETWKGIRVRGGRAHVVMTEEGRIYAIGSDFHPNIDLDPVPAFTAAEAAALAKIDLGYLEGRDREFEPELLVYPEKRDGAYIYRLAWRVELEMEEPLGRWESWVDARDGAIFARRNLYEFVDVTGTVMGDVSDYTPCLGETDLPFRDALVKILETGSTSNTEMDGSFFIENGGGDSVDVWTRMRGPWFFVRDVADGNVDPKDTVRVLPGEPALLYWDDSNSGLEERDAWYHSHQVRYFMKDLDSTFTGLDYRMEVRVNRTDGYCPGNAWWDGTNMNFCREGGSFANTATLADVLYHEYGHGVTQRIYGPFSYDGAVSEANSDILPMLMLSNSMLGVGFTVNNCVQGIRSANNGMIYPDDLIGQGHHDGQLLSGFMWDARSNLITTYGTEAADSILLRLWHYSRSAGKPAVMPDQVTWTFIYDDNDGNLDTGTPNWTELAAAAAEKGFSAPVISAGVHIAHGGLPSTTDSLSDRTVTALAEGLTSGVNPSTVKLFWRVDAGSFTEVAMTPTGNPDEYEATIPAVDQNSRVEYYLEAADSSYHVNWSPPNAPAALHRYDVAWHVDLCESTGAWTLGDPSDDATTGEWINAEPIGSSTRPEYDATPGDGENCFVTGNTGNVRNGKTTLYSPVYDLSGLLGALVRYERWFSNDFESAEVLVGRDDFWTVHATNDGGSTWVEVENTNIGTESWVEIEVPIDSLFPDPTSVQFRFVAQDTGSVTRIHAAVDDLRILAAGSVSTGVAFGEENAPVRFALSENRPNPFNPTTEIAFDIPRASRASLVVYGVNGRRVRTLLNDRVDAGRHHVVWDGADERGRPVASGVYFYRLRSDGYESTRKMVLVR